MQAAARRAAGLPPLEKPTATSVTTVPPPIPAPIQTTPAKRTPSTAVQAPPPGSYNIPPAAAAIAAEARQQHMANLAKQQKTQLSRTPSAAAARRTSSQSKATTPTGAIQRQSSQAAKQQAAHAAHAQAAAAAAAAHAAQAARHQPPTQYQPQQQKMQQQKLQQQRLQQQQQQQTQSQYPQSRPTPAPYPVEARLSSQSAKNVGPGAPHMAPLVGQRIQDLVQSLDPNYTIDIAAEEQLLQLADDFLDRVTRQSIKMAQHRGSKTLDVQDLQLVLAKQWGITVPGLGAPTFRGTVAAAKPTIKRKPSEAQLPQGGGRAKKAATGSGVAVP